MEGRRMIGSQTACNPPPPVPVPDRTKSRCGLLLLLVDTTGVFTVECRLAGAGFEEAGITIFEEG